MFALNRILLIAFLVGLGGLAVWSGEQRFAGDVAVDGAGPDPRPSEWAGAQRLFPFGQADADAYLEALDAARRLRATAKTNPFGVWTLAGPLNIGGRVVDVEFDPLNPATVYAAAATGGVFKSTDTGRTWFPIFDDLAVLTIGDIAVDPVDPDILYVGTGEANGGHNNFAGGGLYKSTDGGITWHFLGLEKTVSIARIRIDPTRPERVFVAAVGSYFGPHPERGVYRSDDGGETWDKILFTGDAVGAIDLVMHPDDPAILYAALWERVRTYDSSRLGGPGSGVYRTKNAGSTWERLGAEHGLPGSNASVGRIGLAQSENQPDVLYALYNDGRDYFGFYKTVNGGDTWWDADVDRDVARGMGGFSWYFGQVRVHPADPNHVYALDVGLMRSVDGGQNWLIRAGGFQGLHVDHHALAVHPENPDYLIVGHDGGISLSTDRGISWEQVEGLPITQFYEIAINPHNPASLYGGTQDNGTIRTRDGNPAGWEQIFGGDGFYVIVDPVDEQVIYAEAQLGLLGKSEDGGQSFSIITPQGIAGRTNWATPVVMDPNDNRVLYYGADRVFRTVDAGSTWVAISPRLPAGFVPSPTLGTITTLAVAPTNSDVIYAGTDDSKVWVSSDFGTTWTDISAGLPFRWVTRVVVNPMDEHTAYTTFSGLKWRDPQPHVFRTTDRGETWTDISGNLPDAPVNAMVVDPSHPSVLYIGSDVGPFVSLDAGGSWQPLGSGMPAVSVYDLKIDAGTRTLVAGTHGRSMYTLNVSGAAVVASEPEHPEEPSFTLEAHAPNPFRDGTTLSYRLAEAGRVRLVIYDVLGRVVKTLVAAERPAGRHTVRWDGTDHQGQSVSSGVYFSRLTYNDDPVQAQTRKLMRTR